MVIFDAHAFIFWPIENQHEYQSNTLFRGKNSFSTNSLPLTPERTAPGEEMDKHKKNNKITQPHQETTTHPERENCQ